MRKTLIVTAATTGILLVGATAALAATITGTAGDDRLVGTNEGDRINGRAGDDVLLGRGGRDYLQGRAGDDVLQGGAGKDYAVGGRGADLMDGGPRADYFLGDAGADTIVGSGGADTLVDWTATEFAPDGGTGPADDDVLRAGAGDDFLGFTDGRDRVWSGRGDDRLRTENDDFADVIDCGPGNDVLAYYNARDPQDDVRGCERVVLRVFD